MRTLPSHPRAVLSMLYSEEHTTCGGPPQEAHWRDLLLVACLFVSPATLSLPLALLLTCPVPAESLSRSLTIDNERQGSWLLHSIACSPTLPVCIPCSTRALSPPPLVSLNCHLHLRSPLSLAANNSLNQEFPLIPPPNITIM